MNQPLIRDAWMILTAARVPLRPSGTHANTKFSCMRHQYLRFVVRLRRMAFEVRASLPHTRCFRYERAELLSQSLSYTRTIQSCFGRVFSHTPSFIWIFVIKSHGVQIAVWKQLCNSHNAKNHREWRFTFRCFFFVLFVLVESVLGFVIRSRAPSVQSRSSLLIHFIHMCEMAWWWHKWQQ